MNNSSHVAWQRARYNYYSWITVDKIVLSVDTNICKLLRVSTDEHV